MNEFLINLRLPAFSKSLRKLDGLTLSDVLYLQAESNYTVFYFRNGKKLMTSFSLGKYRTLESLEFVRANRSYIINTTFIKKVDFEASQLVMKNGASIVISRRRKNNLMGRFEQSEYKLK